MTARPLDISHTTPLDERIAPIKLVIADDHPIVLHGASKVLSAADDIEIVAAVGTIRELYAALVHHPCDVLLCDFAFPNDPEPDGQRLLTTIALRHPAVKVLVFSMHDDPHVVRRLLNGGAAGFLTKSVEDFTNLADIVRIVHRNNPYIDARTTRAIVQAFQDDRVPSREKYPAITECEREVLRLLNGGWSVSEIAERQNRSRQTISAQKKSAMHKLGVQNNCELFDAIKNMF
ncbi:response regulator transcription factor [Burkholderia ubonensis]|uniref:response regulator transcription factor n=1 Tax=Burkholderia ubonensis TaxID=101571 RepID=UPI00076C9E5C|nr:response regulator transcription factor [Burkholderia ubonensis]KVK97035.1 hypothetical protein WJ45_18010 [Burkholderia ubonensis]